MHKCTQPSASCNSAQGHPRHLGVIVLLPSPFVDWINRKINNIITQPSIYGVISIFCYYPNPLSAILSDGAKFALNGNTVSWRQPPDVDQDTFGKVTKDNKHNSQEVSPFPASDHKAIRNRHNSTTCTSMKHNPITVGNFAFLFNCPPSDFKLYDGSDLKTSTNEMVGA